MKIEANTLWLYLIVCGGLIILGVAGRLDYINNAEENYVNTQVSLIKSVHLKIKRGEDIRAVTAYAQSAGIALEDNGDTVKTALNLIEKSCNRAAEMGVRHVDYAMINGHDFADSNSIKSLCNRNENHLEFITRK